MKNKRILCVCAMLSLGFLLSSCGDGDIPLQSETTEMPVEVVAEPLEMELFSGQEETETQSEEGTKQQVSDKAYAEENEWVSAQLDLLIQNLNTPGYEAEGISVLFAEEWFETMMSGQTQGVRCYYRESTGGSWYIVVGYTDEERESTSVWKLTEEEVMVWQQTRDTLLQVKTGVADMQYHGAYEAWAADAATGDVFHEEGSFFQGIMEDYKTEVKWGKAPADIMALWMMREDMEFVSYIGEEENEQVSVLERFGLESYPGFELPEAAGTLQPTAAPTAEPTAAPTAEPTAAPTAEPTVAPTTEPTAVPTTEPTAEPTAAPTATPQPTATPGGEDTDIPWGPDW